MVTGSSTQINGVSQANGTTEIAGIPIWDSSYGPPVTAGLTTPPFNYEGATFRLIKQFDGSTGSNNYKLPAAAGTDYNINAILSLQSGNLSADLDSCTPGAFAVPAINPLPLPQLYFTPQGITGGAIVTIGGTVSNYSTITSALATRIVGATLQLPGPVSLPSNAMLLPVRLKTIGAGGSAQLTSSLTFIPSSPYHGPAVLKITFTHGGASNDAGGSGDTLTERVNIP